ncbi:MAG: hypothetical protein RIR48_1892 [Bacteroidota bacterium]
MYRLKIYIITLMCVVFYFQWPDAQVSAQKSYTKSDVRDMFPANTKNLWINYLSGLIDNRHAADMILGTDGHTCKGLYTLRSSNTTFFFDGENQGQNLKLAEMNDVSRLTGFINGSYDGISFDGQWLNKDKNLQFPFKFSFVNAFENYTPDDRISNQWIRTYKGTSSDKTFDLQIKRDPATFTFKYSDQTKSKYSKVLDAQGYRVEVLKPGFDSTILDNKWVMIDTSNLDKIDIIYPEENGYEVVSSLRLDEAVQFTNYEYADFHSKMECITPVTRSKRFDAWINSLFKSWLDDNIKKFKSTHPDEAGANERWIHNANGWVEVELYESDVISGMIYMQSSFNTKTEKIPFIYDIRYGKELKLQDIFDSKFDSKAYFNTLIPEMVQLANWHPDIRMWFKNQSFNISCLKEKGISFSTQFNTIFGEKEMIIPYEKVRQHLRPRYNF